jgi:hypothetical protein
VLKKVLRPSVILLALTVSITPATKLHADCNIVTGCDPVPPPAPPTHDGIISVLMSMMGLS